MNFNKTYDVAIIGGGPAGVSAAIDAQNNRLTYILFESRAPLWFPKAMINQHVYIDGYLGFGNTTGTLLRDKMLEHINIKNIQITHDIVESVHYDKDCLFLLRSSSGTCSAHNMILATGIKPINCQITGIEKFMGKQVFNFVDIDGYKFKGKKIVVVGGRNSGATAALYIKRNISDDVLLIEKAKKLQASAKYQEQLNENKVKYITNANVISFNGDHILESLSVKHDGVIKNIVTDAAFICAGMKPCLPCMENTKISFNDYGEVIVNPLTMETDFPNLYAVGDINNLRPKQVANACANGKTAVYYIAQRQNYLR